MKNLPLRLQLSLLLTLLLLIIAAGAELVTLHDPYVQNLRLALQPPSSNYPLGTDSYGRCVLCRTIAGSTISIYAGLLLVLLSCTAGSLIGLAAASYGGKIDQLLMRLTDLFLAFPGMVLALAVASVSGGGLVSALLALCCISWPKYARLMRSRVLHLKSRPYIAAAQTWGYSQREILFSQLLPAACGPIISMAALDIGTAMLELAALSFLGLSVQPPAAEWGSMMSSGRSLLQLAPWVIFAPGTALIASVSCFNLLGEFVRESLEQHEY